MVGPVGALMGEAVAGRDRIRVGRVGAGRIEGRWMRLVERDEYVGYQVFPLLQGFYTA